MARPRNVLILILVLIAALVAILIDLAGDDLDAGGWETTAAHQRNPWERLPLPPHVRDGGALVATDDQILLFSGCSATSSQKCHPARSNAALEESPADQGFGEMPR